MFVYFAQAGTNGPVKIGFTRDLIERLTGLGTTQFEELKIIRVVEGTLDTERWFHNLFAAHRKRREWFAFHPDMLTVLPPDPDTLQAEARKKSPHLEKLVAELRGYIMMASFDLPHNATLKMRMRRSSERLGVSLRRVRGYWHGEVRMVPTEEAERIRSLCKAMLLERADFLESEAARMRSLAKRLEGPSGAFERVAAVLSGDAA